MYLNHLDRVNGPFEMLLSYSTVSGSTLSVNIP